MRPVEGGWRASFSSPRNRFSSPVPIRPECLSKSSATLSSTRAIPRPVFAEVVTIGGRWRRRRWSSGRTSSIVTVEGPTSRGRQRRALRLPGDVGGGEVALDDPLARVDQDERDVGPLGRLERAQLRVVLDPLALLALAAQARRVDSWKVRPSRSRTVSIESRVVPGTSETIVRSRADQRVEERRLADVRPAEDRDADRLVARPPARDSPTSLEPRDDLVEQVAGAVAVHARRAASGSPSPSRWSSSASDSCARVVDLVREHEHRLVRERAGSRASSSSPGVTPGARVDDEEDEVGLGDAQRGPARRSSARRRPCSAMSTPPVSISRNRLPAHSQTSSLRSRVVPLVSWTTAARVAVSRLISVDLPTFGKPTIATVPSRSTRSSSSPRAVGRSQRWAPSPRAGRARARSASQSKRTLQPPLDLGARLLVALAALRAGPRSRNGSPTAIEHGREVAELPELRAVDGDRHDRHVLLDRDHRRARLDVPGHAAAAAASPRRRRRSPGRRAASSRIRRTASRSDSPRRTAMIPCQSRNAPKPGHVARLDLRDEVDVAAATAQPTQRDVDPGEVVDREHAAARRAASARAP